MDRLTVYIGGEAREDHSRDTRDWKNGNRECMDRLAAYEDTGMMPDDVAALLAENERLCAALKLAQARTRDLEAELATYKADLDAGRLVRVPNFPQDMDDVLEPLKIQSALNSEVMKLNHRLEHRPKDVSILDYTIIAALYGALTDARAALEKESTHG